MFELSIIIPTKNRPDQLKNCLHNIIEATKNKACEIIVVNDGNDVNIHYSNVQLIKNEGRGVASARNTGARKALADLLLFIDDDMLINENSISRILMFHKDNENVALNLNWEYPEELLKSTLNTAFGRYLNKYGFNSLKGWSKSLNEWNDHKTFRSSGITSQNLSLSKNTFFSIGGYNETFPFAGFEDFDFSKRLQQQQIKSFIDPKCMTYHNESDRQELKPWLERKFRGGLTRRIAVHLGHDDLQINYPIYKEVILNMLSFFKPILILVLSKLNRSKIFDQIYFRTVNILLATSIFEGYTSKLAIQYLTKSNS